ncbi:GPI-anchor transamidase-like [Hylaeus volcanicus]|uniref:GPI-anchor transamidase-like n=1 Tax=Hylaeus volcanicus TaxID=313075 RepID=UPI0023B77EB7|nr:GPI-anchor transamidase-like [Hylaeus volcanicus]
MTTFKKWVYFFLFNLISNALRFMQCHKTNWAVLVSTSRFYTNYRHTANVLAVYQGIRRLGIPNSHIILMLADGVACDPRNPSPGVIYSCSPGQNAYLDDIEIDYKGLEVTEESFRRVLTGRHSSFTPQSKRLLSDSNSNVLIYLTGHSGEAFVKFHDFEELTSTLLAHTIEHMYQMRRYKNLLFIADTCQAETILSDIYSPNVIAIGSSRRGENSYSHGINLTFGSFTIDRFTYYLGLFLKKLNPTDFNTSLHDFLVTLSPDKLDSNYSTYVTSPASTNFTTIPMTDFFGMTGVLKLFFLTLTEPPDPRFPLAKLYDA